MSTSSNNISASELERVIQNNRKQTVSETDTFTEERYGQMTETLPSGEITVLDVGCGLGRGGKVIRMLRNEISLIGLDCVPERVDSLDPNIYSQALVGFTQDLPFEDRSVDAIVAGEFLEHVPPKYIDPTLCEFFRVLKVRGVFSMTTPNPCYIRNRLQGLSVLSDQSHVTQHYPKILKTRLMGIGFSGIRIKGTGKVSRFLGTKFPLFLYGSYLLSARKW
jgi:ubiquinone/menaquinone biosynthesis C-methylase UbiE